MLVILLSFVTSICASISPKYPTACSVSGHCGSPFCGPNAHFDFCPPRWPPQFCSSIWARHIERSDGCGDPSCRCNDGYLRHEESGECITIDDCLYRCYGHEHLEHNCSICQRTCANKYVTGPDSECKPYTGCVCNKGYVRLYDDASGPCIPEDKCPPKCGPHEKPTKCEKTCPPQTCERLYNTYTCENKTTCIPGCNCIDNYLRNELGICIPKEFCPIPPDVAEKYRCIPTCAIPNPPNCPNNIYNCGPGYVLSERGGICISIEDCPRNLGCNGDPHARVTEYPLPCPSTCDRPNAVNCLRIYDPIGCECKPGYILSQYNGRCIPHEKCPGGNPCGVNATLVPCKVPCSSDYCPTEDLIREEVCETPYDCLPGCVCKFNYRRKSQEDETCILARECPPVECTRQNEAWHSCPSNCVKEYCDNVDRKTLICNRSLLFCVPRCACKDNYYRNGTDICVTAEECCK